MLAYGLASKPCSKIIDMMISLFCRFHQCRNKSQTQGNSPTKPIDILKKSLYNSKCVNLFYSYYKDYENGGGMKEVFSDIMIV